MTTATVTPVNSNELEDLFGRDKTCEGWRGTTWEEKTWECGKPAEFRVLFKCSCGSHSTFLCASCLECVRSGNGNCGYCLTSVTKWRMS